jgi:hypothetical protein
MSIFPVPPELKLTACLLLLLACSLPVLAAPAIYDVEVIIFTNNTSGDNGERSSKPAGVSGNTGAFRDGEFTELARGLYRLDNISNALQQSRGYSVLFHRAWRQLATGREAAAAYPVHSLVSGNSGIEGNVRLVLERYLHLDVNLMLMSSRGTGGAVYSDGPGSVPVYELREQRRIRSGELHYFDHPRFGMIARVTPYAIPEAAAVTEPAAAPEPEDPVPAPVDDQLTR